VRKDILVQMNLKCELGTNMNANVTLASGNCGAFQTKPNASNWENKLTNRNYSVHSKGGSQNCAFFIQSFNRENLKYAVRYKQSMNVALEEITNLIKSKFVFWFLLFYLNNKILLSYINATVNRCHLDPCLINFHLTLNSSSR
jgi:hypothetical protein